MRPAPEHAALLSGAGARRPAAACGLAALALAACSLVACTAGGDRGSSRPAPSDLAGTLPRTAVGVVDRARWQTALGWSPDCEAAFQASRTGSDGGLTFHQIDGHTALVQVLCAAGSYQPSQVFLRLDERPRPAGAETLHFPSLQSDDGVTLHAVVAAELWGDAAVLDNGHALTVLSLARQLGDCGVWARYTLDAPAPRLAEAWARLPCPEQAGTRASPARGEPPAGWTRVPLEAGTP